MYTKIDLFRRERIKERKVKTAMERRRRERRMAVQIYEEMKEEE